MNTFNEFELNAIKKFYTEEIEQRRLERSKSAKLRPMSSDPNNTWQHHRSHQSSRPQSKSADRVASHSAGTQQFRFFSSSPTGAHRTWLESGHVLEGPAVDLKRYERALSSKRSGKQSAKATCKGVAGKFARVLFNFQARNETELSLRRGDLVELLDELDQWAMAEDCQSGLQGLVPLSYLDSTIGCALARRDVASARAHVPQVLPESRAHELLPMSKGEPIALIRRLSGHWYEASNMRHSFGLVWSADVDVLSQPMLDSEATKTGRSKSQSSVGRATGDWPVTSARAQSSVCCGRVRARNYVADEFNSSDNDEDDDRDDVNDNDDHIGNVDSFGTVVQVSESDVACDDEEEILILESGERVLRSRTHQHRLKSQPSKRPPLKQQQDQCSASRALQDRTCSCKHRQLPVSAREPSQTQQRQVPRRSSSSPYICSALLSSDVDQQADVIKTNASVGIGVGELNHGADSDAAEDVGRKRCESHHRTSHEPGEPLPRLCRARFPYKPQQKDELELVAGDILVVVHECDDGWLIGNSCTSKRMGTFPGNFVEPI